MASVSDGIRAQNLQTIEPKEPFFSAADF